MPLLSDQDNQIVSEIWANQLSLAEVWRTYKQVYLHTSVSFEQASLEYLDYLLKQNRSQAYIDSMRWVLDEMRSLISDEIPLPQHTTFLLQCALDRTKNRDHKRRRLSSFYAWCHKMRYLPAQVALPCQDRARLVGDPGMLTNKSVHSMLSHCPDGLLGHLWLCLCMGLRVAEACRVEDLECRDGYLIVGAKASKTRSRRVIAMLEGHQRYADLVRPQTNLRDRMERLREAAGIKDWPRNCMRHTAASHWLNYYQDEQKAALHLGHSPAMLHRHYKALVTQAESEEFFGLW